MSEDKKLKTCANCAVWNTEYRLANKVTSCAKLGFSAEDTCKNWTAPFHALVRVKEPSLAQILQESDIRDPWKSFHNKLSVTSAYYNEEDGHYYYFFDKAEDLQEAERFARILSSEKYVKKSQGNILPLRYASLEDTDKERFQKIAKASKDE